MSIKRSKDPAKYRVQSVYDAFRLLELLTRAQRQLAATEIAAALGDKRNRVFRLLQTLEESGYIVQDANSRAYRPSLKLASLGHAVIQNHNLEDIARPVIQRLGSQTAETVYIAARDRDEVVCLLNLESDHLMRICAQPGHRWPLGHGAAGQALLLSMSEQFRAEYLSQHPEISQQFPKVQAHYDRDGVTYVDGFDGYTDEGVMAIATSVQSYLKDEPLALAIAWPNSRSSVDYEVFRELLLESTTTLERALGSYAVQA